MQADSEHVVGYKKCGSVLFQHERLMEGLFGVGVHL